MYVSLLNFTSNITNINRQKPVSKANNSNYLKPLACDCVSFSGALKQLENSDDQTFVAVLAKEYNLGDDAKKELEEVVSEFLKEYNFSSLEGLSDEKYEDTDDQVILHQRLKNIIMSYSNDINADENEDELSSYLADELTQRVMARGNYIPQGRAAHSLEECSISGIFTMDKDKIFYEFVKDTLRLSPFEIYEFKKIVSEFLKEKNMKSVPELFSGIETAESQAVLMDRLTEKFDFSSTVADAIHWEFLMRADAEKRIGYKPKTSRYKQEQDSIEKIVENGGYDPENKTGFYVDLFKVMSDDAQNNGYDSIFEIFRNKDKFAKSETYKFIMDSNLTEEQKGDLCLDLAMVSDDPKSFAARLPKDPIGDNFYADVQLYMMADRLAKDYGYNPNSEAGMIFFTDVKDILRGIYPEHVNGGKNINKKQAAFEILYKYNLPAGEENNIIKIISEVLDGGRKAADKFIVSSLLNGAQDIDIKDL